VSDNILIASLGSPNSIALKYPRPMLDHELVLDVVHELGLYLTRGGMAPNGTSTCYTVKRNSR
jgi:hypothetical protein